MTSYDLDLMQGHLMLRRVLGSIPDTIRDVGTLFSFCCGGGGAHPKLKGPHRDNKYANSRKHQMSWCFFFCLGSFNVGLSVTAHEYFTSMSLEYFTSMSLILSMLSIFLTGCWRSTAKKTFWLFHLWILYPLTYRLLSITEYLLSGVPGKSWNPAAVASGTAVPLKCEQPMRYFNTEIGICEHLF